jgi:hypothetical protein
MELEEDTVEAIYEYLTLGMSAESASFLKDEYTDSSDMMECLGRAIFNQTVLEALKAQIESDG